MFNFILAIRKYIFLQEYKNRILTNNFSKQKALTDKIIKLKQTKYR
jgi:hypothetical protein